MADYKFSFHEKGREYNPAWMAPELIKKENYNELVDVWSVGVIAVELAEG